MPVPKKSPLELLKAHINKWKDGCGSEYCSRSKYVCHVRGQVPADVVFVGEAPGDSEDILGFPFKGPAGVHFQQRVIQKAIPHQIITDPKTGERRAVSMGVRYALMNLTGCIPRNEEGTKEGAPDPEAIRQCAPRLLELLDLCKPKLIVCVGKESEEAFDPWLRSSVLLVNPTGQKFIKTPRISILHPAYIIRMHITNQGLEFQRTALKVQQAIEEYILDPQSTPEPNGSDPVSESEDPIPF